MKFKLSSLLALLIVPTLSFSQVSIERDVVATAGENSSTPSMDVSWTIGELAINNQSNGNLMITEGFQQGEQDFTGINDDSNMTNINVFPNPVTDILNYSIASENRINLSLQLYDELGRLVEQLTPLHDEEITKGQIDMTEYAAGQWTLRFYSDLEGVIKTFNIVKLN